MFRQLVGLAAMGLALVALGGCGAGGPALYEVKGKVAHKGAAVSGATLTFMNAEGKMSTGTTDAQGEFSLVTFGKPGALPGDYKVGISKVAGMEGASASPKPEDMIKMMQMQGKEKPKPKNELPAKYQSPETSVLTATVTTDATKNVFTFDLKEE